MENASRAIVMVGGVLLAMLLLALLAYAWNQYAEYQTSQDSITDVEDVAKFNEQFSNYDRDDVQGYELISLSNKVADYNNRYASDSAEGATGTGSYNTLTLTITFTDKDREQLAFNPKDNNYLFKYNRYKQEESSELIKNCFTNDEGSGVYDIAVAIESTFGSSSNATRVAKAINDIFYYYSNGNPTSYASALTGYDDDEIKKLGVDKYNSCVSVANRLTYDDVDNLVISTRSGSLYLQAIQYYEYMMFKTMVFECTKITYDAETQRVSSMAFECTGKFAD